MITPESTRHLRLIALHGVVKEPVEYVLRHIMRWYSREFSTPLEAVMDLPLEDVLLHYFECGFEDKRDDEIQAEISRLTTPPEEMAEKRKQEDFDDADDWEFGQEALAAQPQAVTAPLVDPITARLDALRNELKMEPAMRDAQTTLPVPKITEPLEPGIHMTFEDIETDEFPDAPSFGPPSKLTP